MGLSETLKAISAPVRREILDYLKSGPGLIEEEKQKNFIYYSLNLTVFEEILTWIQSLGGKEDEK